MLSLKEERVKSQEVCSVMVSYIAIAAVENRRSERRRMTTVVV